MIASFLSDKLELDYKMASSCGLGGRYVRNLNAKVYLKTRQLIDRWKVFAWSFVRSFDCSLRIGSY